MKIVEEGSSGRKMRGKSVVWRGSLHDVLRIGEGLRVSCGGRVSLH